MNCDWKGAKGTGFDSQGGQNIVTAASRPALRTIQPPIRPVPKSLYIRN